MPRKQKREKGTVSIILVELHQINEIKIKMHLEKNKKELSKKLSHINEVQHIKERENKKSRHYCKCKNSQNPNRCFKDLESIISSRS